MSETCILTAAQMRRADQMTIDGGDAAFTLMQRAGVAVAAAVLECMPDYGRIVIVAGPGNNAGDGFAAACRLRKHRVPVTVVSLVSLDHYSADIQQHAQQAADAGCKLREACSDDNLAELERWLLRAVLVVDCLFGTGLSRPLQGRMADVVARINMTERLVLSVDIASGICADSGHVLGAAVQADFTLPIAASKWGHWLSAGRDYTGLLLPVADIGIDVAAMRQAWHESCNCADAQQCLCVRRAHVIQPALLQRAWPARSRLSHKGSYGHVWVFGGSPGLTGAPQLAALGAYAAGAGLASIACPDAVWPLIAAASLETMVHPQSSAAWQGADVLLAGSGWGEAQEALLLDLAAADQPLVLDAGALRVLAESVVLQQALLARRSLTVLTPHPGEAAALLAMSAADVQADRKQAVLALTARYGCWVVLKGSETLIASPQRELDLNSFGSAQLAVAGTGDVLAGMIAAGLAVDCRRACPQPNVAIAAAVALHGKAGQRSGWYLAGELAAVVADMRREIEADAKQAGKQL